VSTVVWDEAAFVGGHPVLDFTNTTGGRLRERDVDRLGTYGDLIGWASAAGVLEEGEAAELATLEVADPEGAAGALERVRAQREALQRYLAAAVGEAAVGEAAVGEASVEVSAGDGPERADADRERVAADVVDAFRHARLGADPTTGPGWVLTVADSGLALLGRRVALATAALLAGEERRRIGLCGRCSWLFLDPSPSRRRRWCSMATCGNRAKAARHHARTS
jgi:predicted RNA-binding Zn ribbon-like protein